MPAGRPRTTSPPPEECIELGKEIVKWATEKTKKDEKRLFLKQWWCLVKGMSKNEWDALCHTEFLPYYQKAQVAIATRYIDGTVNPSIAQRFLRLYFPDLQKNEDEKSVSDAQARAQALVQETQALQVTTINYHDEKRRKEKPNPSS